MTLHIPTPTPTPKRYRVGFDSKWIITPVSKMHESWQDWFYLNLLGGKNPTPANAPKDGKALVRLSTRHYDASSQCATTRQHKLAVVPCYMYRTEKTLMGCADPPRRPKRGVGAPHQCPRVDRKTKWSSVDGQSLPAPTELPPRCRPTLPPTRGRVRLASIWECYTPLLQQGVCVHPGAVSYSLGCREPAIASCSCLCFVC